MVVVAIVVITDVGAIRAIVIIVVVVATNIWIVVATIAITIAATCEK